MNIVKLIPAYKSIIWGGEKLKKYYGKQTDASPLAETWELSLHKAGESMLPDGRYLSEVATESDFGENCKDFSFFPVLIKFIDANAKLSIQVHPDDSYALENENSLGKTEMWYIVEADEGAGIYLGLKNDISRETFENAIKNNTLTDYLSFIPVKKGECYFIPSGTIHAICEGCLIYEIQQNSNVTYRVYDYGRKDMNGNERELHVDKALAVSNLRKYECKKFESDVLGVSKYFNVRRLEVSGTRYCETNQKSFCCITCVDGDGSIDGQDVHRGDSFFVPAGYGQYALSGNMTVIITDIRKYFINITASGNLTGGAIVDDNGEVITTASQVLDVSSEEESIISLCNLLTNKVNMTNSDITEIIFQKGILTDISKFSTDHQPLAKEKELLNTAICVAKTQ